MSMKKNKKCTERVLTLMPFLLYYVYMKRLHKAAGQGAGPLCN